MKNVLNKLFNIQQELKVPKSQRNNFGNYNFRNCEDIMEASKPICAKHKCLLTCSDEIIVIGEHEPNLYEEIYYDKDLKKENVRKITTGQQRLQQVSKDFMFKQRLLCTMSKVEKVFR